MRYKVLAAATLIFGASFGYAQDINRAKEWHYKRAERPQAKVMVETKFNGVAAPVGEDPQILDNRGNPVRRRDEEKMESDQSEEVSATTVKKQSDRLVRSEFEAAGAVVDEPEKEKTSPVLVGSIFLIIGLLAAVAFSFAAKKIKVPAQL